MFYSETCPHCIAMKADIEGIEKMFKNNDRVIIMRVEGNNDGDLAEAEKVSGYPTLNIYTLNKQTNMWSLHRECQGRSMNAMLICIEEVQADN